MQLRDSAESVVGTISAVKKMEASTMCFGGQHQSSAFSNDQQGPVLIPKGS